MTAMDSSNTRYNLPVRNLNTLIYIDIAIILFSAHRSKSFTFPSVAMTANSCPLGEKITEVGVTLCYRKNKMTVFHISVKTRQHIAFTRHNQRSADLLVNISRFCTGKVF